MPLNDKVVKEKTKYYLGTFVGYFLGIYVCMYLFSFTNYGKITARKLYDTAFQSQLYLTVVNNDEPPSAMICIQGIYRMNGAIRNILNHERMLVSMGHVQSAKRTRLIDNIVLSEDENKYSKGFRDYVNQRRTILGCDSFLYPSGYRLQLPSWIRKELIILPPGRFESILMYICSNHPLFTCFYYMEGSKLGAHGTRILYLGKDIVVFVLYQFSHMILGYLSLDSDGLSTFINLFVITPSAVSVGLILQYLYTCPFTDTIDFKRKYAAYESIILFLGRLAIVPLIILMAFSLFMACLFSNGRQIPLILVNYFISVQFYGVLLGLIKAFLHFRHDFYYRLSLFGVLEVLCVGNLFAERIVTEHLVADVDYAHRSRTYLSVITISIILNRDDAIRAKWIDTNSYTTSIPRDAPSDNSKLTSSNNNVSPYRDYHHSVEEEEAQVELNVVSYDNIYDTADPDEKLTEAETKSVESTVIVATTTNPLLANVTTKRQNAADIINNTTTNEDDDDALREMYVDYQQSLHNSNQEGKEGSEDMLSFQDWILKRKEFKQGTRKSFVKAFQVFEEREQLAEAQSSKEGTNASMANVIKLYKNVQIAKNILLSNVSKK